MLILLTLVPFDLRVSLSGSSLRTAAVIKSHLERDMEPVREQDEEEEVRVKERNELVSRKRENKKKTE